MEGGGEWVPEPGIDYFGHSNAMITFDGEAVGFDDIPLVMAEETSSPARVSRL